MTERTYPRQAWVLMPSFKPVEITLEKLASASGYKGYESSEKGKIYHISDLYETKEAAIAAGHFKCEIDEQKASKIHAKVYKRRQALELASVQ